MQMVVTVLAAIAGGLLADRVRIPGGLLVGAMIGSAAVSLSWGRPVSLPIWAGALLFTVVGVMIGTAVNRERVRALAPIAGVAIGSAALLIVAGGAIAYLLTVLGIAPPAVILATSPGALSVLVATAAEYGQGEAEVALFHVVRIMVVVLAAPLLIRLVRTDED